MKEIGAPLGGELSGHICFADNYIGIDDAPYDACRLVDLLARKNRPFSELVAELPQYVATPEIRIEVDEKKKWEVVEQALEYFRKSHEVIDVDGARILFAWKKSDRLDDYHLHELDLASGKVRQLTFGLGFADYEGEFVEHCFTAFDFSGIELTPPTTTFDKEMTVQVGDKAVELYKLQHDGEWPGTVGNTTNWATFVAQMTLTTDRAGNPGGRLGPYLRTGIPENPFTGTNSGVVSTTDIVTPGTGWHFNPETGVVSDARDVHVGTLPDEGVPGQKGFDVG